MTNSTMEKLRYRKNRLLMATVAGAVVIGLGSFPKSPAQSLKAAQPTFDVASVKQVDISKLGDLVPINIASVRGQEITFGNATLGDCIRFAYGIAADAQIVGPDWIRSKRFLYDIDAKGGHDTSSEQFQAMMQTLLTDRFNLVTHREQKVMSYYALVPAKRRPTIQEIKEIPEGFQGITHGGHIDSILPMPTLAYLLSRFETERPIIDKTAFSGVYRVKLDWALRQTEDAGDVTGPSLFTALDEQLGLKLEARRGPVEILVVESAEKIPTPN
jgi:uncharacterized protein (TIGR03435 family)